MYQYINVLLHNIDEVILDRKQYKDLPKRLHEIQMVPVGTKTGLMQVNGMSQQEDTAPFKKDEIAETTMKAL